MSQSKPKHELVRLAWLAALRRDGHRQCTGALFHEDRKRVCAIGLLQEVAGFPQITKADLDANEWNPNFFYGAQAGLTPGQTENVISMNDGDGVPYERKHTFAEIADVVARWFK